MTIAGAPPPPLREVYARRHSVRLSVVRGFGVGAPQGLNFVAANLLRWLGEEEAFWTLLQIVEVLQPRDYYTNMVQRFPSHTFLCLWRWAG